MLRRPRFLLAAAVFGLALTADLATKALLADVTYYGVGVAPFAPKPLWLIGPALAALLVRSRLVTVAACLTLAGTAGNAISPVGGLDFGPGGSWSLADVYLADGLIALLLALTWRLRTMLGQRPQHSAG